jgi:SAM-dependent MidA family methyltransferase
VHVFDDPGSADLTANVDFAYLKESLEGVGEHRERYESSDYLQADAAFALQPTHMDL